jgi:hypothetical protein
MLIKGTPVEVFSKLAPHTENISFEIDTEPYALERDAKIDEIC